jgi:hypothetical protein
MQTPARGDFPASPKPSKSTPCTPPSVLQNETKTTAEEDTMNVDTLELNAVAEAAMTEEAVEILALSIDDLDLVGGGSQLGVGF